MDIQKFIFYSTFVVLIALALLGLGFGFYKHDAIISIVGILMALLASLLFSVRKKI